MSTKNISDLARAITMLKNTPMAVVPKDDPYAQNTLVLKQLQKQVSSFFFLLIGPCRSRSSYPRRRWKEKELELDLAGSRRTRADSRSSSLLRFFLGQRGERSSEVDHHHAAELSSLRGGNRSIHPVCLVDLRRVARKDVRLRPGDLEAPRSRYGQHGARQRVDLLRCSIGSLVGSRYSLEEPRRELIRTSFLPRVPLRRDSRADLLPLFFFLFSSLSTSTTLERTIPPSFPFMSVSSSERSDSPRPTRSPTTSLLPPDTFTSTLPRIPTLSNTPSSPSSSPPALSVLLPPPRLLRATSSTSRERGRRLPRTRPEVTSLSRSLDRTRPPTPSGAGVTTR